MHSKSLLLFSSLLLLASCGGTSSSSSPIPSSSPSSEEPSAPSPSSVEEEKDILEEFRDLSKKVNYSIYIEDYGGNFTEVFLSDAFYYKFDDETSFTGYLTDEGGVYPFTVSSNEVVSFDYHVYDETSDSIITDLYEAMYSLKDCPFLEESFEKRNDGSYSVDLSSDDAAILYMVCGFEVESSHSGMSLSDLDGMYIGRNEEGNPSISFAFNETSSGRGTSTASIIDVGTSVLDPIVQKALDDGLASKKRIPADNDFYKELATLKNMRNYTLEIVSNYTSGTWTNYTTTTKYTANSYYSTSSRSTDSDLGFTMQDGVVHTLIYDEVSNSYIVGGTFTSSTSTTYTDILDVVYSFADTSWNPKSFEARIDEGRYLIEDYDYMYVLTQMVNDTYFSFMIEGYYLDKDGGDYVFTLQLHQIGTLTMRVTDIGTTVIN